MISVANKASYPTQSPGQYKVIVTNTSGCAESSAIFDLVVTSISPLIGPENKIHLYPNPAQNYVSIELDKIPEKPILLQLINANGTLFDSWNIYEQKKTINVELLAPGKYWLRVNEDKSWAIPFIKQ
jgi:hypothetical protein